MKKNYVKITYTNCDSLEYDYTICEWQNIEDNLYNAKEDMKNFDRKEFEDKNHAFPSVTIEPVFMTDDEYDKWFVENVESNA